MSESRVRENRTHGSRRRREAPWDSRQARTAYWRLLPTLVQRDELFDPEAEIAVVVLLSGVRRWVG